MAIYVADLDTLQLRHILAGYAHPITCIDWNPRQPNEIVCAAMDGTVSVWDVDSEVTLYTLALDSAPILVQWCRGDAKVAIASENGIVRFWEPIGSNSLVSRDFNFSKITVMRWNSRVTPIIASGHQDCSLNIYNLSSQTSHRIKCADSKFGGHTGGVLDLQWDPLSDIYLIASFGSGQMALFDTEKRVQVSRPLARSPLRSSHLPSISFLSVRTLIRTCIRRSAHSISRQAAAGVSSGSLGRLEASSQPPISMGRSDSGTSHRLPQVSCRVCVLHITPSLDGDALPPIPLRDIRQVMNLFLSFCCRPIPIARGPHALRARSLILLLQQRSDSTAVDIFI